MCTELIHEQKTAMSLTFAKKGYYVSLVNINLILLGYEASNACLGMVSSLCHR